MKDESDAGSFDTSNLATPNVRRSLFTLVTTVRRMILRGDDFIYPRSMRKRTFADAVIASDSHRLLAG